MRYDLDYGVGKVIEGDNYDNDDDDDSDDNGDDDGDEDDGDDGDSCRCWALPHYSFSAPTQIGNTCEETQ